MNNISRLEFLKTEVKQWSRLAFGSILERKHRCWSKLAGIQRKLCVSVPVFS